MKHFNGPWPSLQPLQRCVRGRNTNEKKITVLIVEDNAGIRRLLRRILLDTAGSIWECSDGSEALAAYETHKPDLVLRDFRMPRVDGLTATRQIRDRDPSALIIVVTDYEGEDMRSAALAAGAHGFVLKQEISDLPMVVSSLPNASEA